MPQITLDQWQQLSALAVPFIVAFVVQSHWQARVKRGVAVALALLAALVPELIQHKVNSTDLVAEVLVVVVATQGFYHVFKAKFDGLTASTDTTQPAAPVRPPGA